MVLFLDLETNGFAKSSVLQCSAFKFERNFLEKKIIKPVMTYDRYFFPRDGEKFNSGAGKVHGLTPTVIYNKRKEYYHKYFDKELNDNNSLFNELVKDVTIIVGHNIDFDIQFLSPDIQKLKKCCTMKLNKSILNLKNIVGSPKNPKLMECVEYYNIEYDETKLHNALYDIEMTVKVYMKTAEKLGVIPHYQ